MYCPKCKTKLEKFGDRKARCPQCGFTFYNNPKPCVSVVITKEGKALLAKRGIEPERGKWDLLGGFLEGGEVPEECVLREVKEETGLDVKIEKFLGFFADKYYNPTNDATISTLNMGYLARIKENNAQFQAQDDVAELQWFEFDNLPANLAFKNTKHFLSKITAD